MYTPAFSMKKSKLPVVSKEELNRIGEEIVGDFDPIALLTPKSLDVDRFLDYLGLDVDYQYLSHNGCFLGVTVFGDTNCVPIYDPSTRRAEYVSAKAGTVIIDNRLLEVGQEHRYRFTGTHEGCHGILHKSYFEYQQKKTKSLELLSCAMRPKYLERSPRGEWSDEDWLEWQANQLASCILMPKSMIQTVVDSVGKNNPKQLIATVSALFDVSTASARYRLGGLGYVKLKETGL